MDITKLDPETQQYVDRFDITERTRNKIANLTSEVELDFIVWLNSEHQYINTSSNPKVFAFFYETYFDVYQMEKSSVHV